MSSSSTVSAGIVSSLPELPPTLPTLLHQSSSSSPSSPSSSSSPSSPSSSSSSAYSSSSSSSSSSLVSSSIAPVLSDTPFPSGYSITPLPSGSGKMSSRELDILDDHFSRYSFVRIDAESMEIQDAFLYQFLTTKAEDDDDAAYSKWKSNQHRTLENHPHLQRWSVYMLDHTKEMNTLLCDAWSIYHPSGDIRLTFPILGQGGCMIYRGAEPTSFAVFCSLTASLTLSDKKSPDSGRAEPNVYIVLSRRGDDGDNSDNMRVRDGEAAEKPMCSIPESVRTMRITPRVPDMIATSRIFCIVDMQPGDSLRVHLCSSDNDLVAFTVSDAMLGLHCWPTKRKLS